MKRGRLSLAIGAVSVPALGLALGLGLGAVTTAAHASAKTGTHASQLYSERIVVLNCLGKAQVRPSSFILACADANDYLTKLSWTSWGPDLASAVGTQEENDCIPYCAAGHFHAYPVDVDLLGQHGADRLTGNAAVCERHHALPGSPARPSTTGTSTWKASADE